MRIRTPHPSSMHLYIFTRLYSFHCASKRENNDANINMSDSRATFDCNWGQIHTVVKKKKVVDSVSEVNEVQGENAKDSIRHIVNTH